MNYGIKKIDINLNTVNDNIINSTLTFNIDNTLIDYKVIKYLGKGTAGSVYLIKSDKNEYAIKIGNNDAYTSIEYEIIYTQKYFHKNKITHIAYPVFYANINNLKRNAIIFPFLGHYNLSNIKKHKEFKINSNMSIMFIRSIIMQLKEFKNIIHCDLKSSNIVLHCDKHYNYIPVIIDFGLIKDISKPDKIISTIYISSPESLFTNSVIKKNVKKLTSLNMDSDKLYSKITFDKHDYFGLFSIIIDMVSTVDIWNILSAYLETELKLSKDIITDSIEHYVYMWYRFNYTSLDDVTDLYYKYLIITIEELIPNIKDIPYISFKEFFTKYIEKNLICSNNIYPFLESIIRFIPKYRPSYDEILNNHFLSN